MSADDLASHIHIAVVHDWRPSPRHNAFGEDMRTDQIHVDVVETIVGILNEMDGVSAEPVLIDKLEAAASGALPWHGAINLAYGEYGRFHMASAPLLLDRLGVPNFGSDPFLMLLTRNKQHTKNIAVRIGVQTAPSVYYDRATAHLVEAMPKTVLPAIVKPNEAASGLGLADEIYTTAAAAKARTASLLIAYPEGVIVERFIPGEEITVAVLSDGQDIKTFAYVLKEPDGSSLLPTYINSYTANLEAYSEGRRLWKDLNTVDCIQLADEACEKTARLVREFGINGYTRADYRVSIDGELFFLELNGQAGIGLGPSVVTTIGQDHYGDRLGFVRAFAETAVHHLRVLRSGPSKGHKRWAYQTRSGVDAQ